MVFASLIFGFPSVSSRFVRDLTSSSKWAPVMPASKAASLRGFSGASPMTDGAGVGNTSVPTGVVAAGVDGTLGKSVAAIGSPGTPVTAAVSFTFALYLLAACSAMVSFGAVCCFGLFGGALSPEGAASLPAGFAACAGILVVAGRSGD